MNSVHSMQQFLHQACAFDFIQNILSSIIPIIECNRKNAVITAEKLQVEKFYCNNNYTNTKNGSNDVDNRNNDSDIKTVFNNMKLQPSLKDTKSELYQQPEIEKTNQNNIQNNNQNTNNVFEKNSNKYQKKTKLIVENIDIIPTRTVLYMPDTKHTEITEYRTAYLSVSYYMKLYLNVIAM